MRELSRFAHDEQLDEVVEGLDVVEETPELQNLVLATVAQQIGAYHAVYGAIVAPGEPLSVRSFLPNPFGGRPLPARQVVTLDTVADADGCVAVDLRTRPRPGPTRRILAESVAEMSDGAVSPDELLEDLAHFELGSETHFAWDPDTTWMAGVVVDVHADLGPDSQSQHMEYVAHEG
jgi:hypothetical protein